MRPTTVLGSSFAATIIVAFGILYVRATPTPQNTYDGTPYPSFAGFNQGDADGAASPGTDAGNGFDNPFNGFTNDGDVANPLSGLGLPQIPRLRGGGRGRGGGRNTTAGNDTTPANDTTPVVPDPVGGNTTTNGTTLDPGNNTTTTPPPTTIDPCELSTLDPFCCDFRFEPECQAIYGPPKR